MKNVYRNGLLFIIAGIFLAPGGDVLAYTVNRSPAGLVSSESFTFTIDNSAGDLCQETPAQFGDPGSGPATGYFYEFLTGPIGSNSANIAFFSQTFDINNLSPMVVTHSSDVVIKYYKLICNFQNVSGSSGGFFDDNNQQQRDFTFLAFTAPPPGPVAAAPLSFSLFATSTPSTDILASVGSSVQETGKAIWPMFAFLGVGAAFIIALQVMVFTKRAVNGTGGPNDGKSSRSYSTNRRKKRRKRRKI
jgi:hypothetical protein